MKIIAFLFMITLLSTQPSYDVQASSVLSSQVTTSQSSNDDNTYTFKIDVHGEHSFTTELNPTTYRININTITTDGTNFIFYGYTTENRNHDSLLIILNTSGDVLQHTVFENGKLSEIDAHYIIDDTLIFKETHSSYEDGAEYEVQGVTFFKLDDALKKSTSVSIDKPVQVIIKEDPYIYIQDTYQGPYIMALDKNLEVYENDMIYGVTNHQHYTGEVNLFFLNTLFFNNHTHTNFLTIDYPGHYQITYENHTINFTIDPIIDGVTNDTIYQEPVRISTPKGRLLLNDELYLNNDIIDNPGAYELIVEGANGYQKTINFTITSQLNGVFNDQTYNENRTLEFNGIGFLNGRYIESGYRVENPGSYTLEIHGENDYLETINFELDTLESPQSSNPTLIIEIVLLSIVIVIAGGLIVKTKFF